eukprot:TRINITY_DN35459_c0_g1_i2.p1 TRINITY_DN35459_c0_g1~~TRINITY_DN35459_c0_g1_i2.p1  ORF type:complete len:506 (+),score=118.63 TRINITY_DN35459_c0_g1_i2:577-2094(+)
MLQDVWEELVSDLRSNKATFLQLAAALSRPVIAAVALAENKDFLLDRSRSLVLANAHLTSCEDMRAARSVFPRVWPQWAEQATRAARSEVVDESIKTLMGIKKKEAPAAEGHRTEFMRELMQMAAGGEDPADEKPEPFALTVDRNDVFWSTLGQLQTAAPEDLRRPLEVRFQGEAAEDAGGPRREFFNEFGRAMASTVELWSVTPRGSLAPAPAVLAQKRCPNDEERRSVYQRCGRVFGMALCQSLWPPQQTSYLMGLPLASHMLGLLQGAELASLEELQAALNAEQREDAPDFRGSAAMRTQPLSSLGLEGQLTFSRQLPGGDIVDLTPNGRSTVVTDDNKLAWLKATLRSELVDSIADSTEAFRCGVREVAGAAPLVMLHSAELHDLWAGRGVVTDEDLATWKEKTVVSPARTQQGQWLFELLQGELRDARARVLKFATGSDRWPIDASGFEFTVEPMDGGDDTLPRAMTCGNMLQLPVYSARDFLRERLLKAIDWGTDMQSM